MPRLGLLNGLGGQNPHRVGDLFEDLVLHHSPCTPPPTPSPSPQGLLDLPGTGLRMGPHLPVLKAEQPVPAGPQALLLAPVQLPALPGEVGEAVHLHHQLLPGPEEVHLPGPQPSVPLKAGHPGPDQRSGKFVFIGGTGLVVPDAGAASTPRTLDRAVAGQVFQAVGFPVSVGSSPITPPLVLPGPLAEASPIPLRPSGHDPPSAPTYLPLHHLGWPFLPGPSRPRTVGW